MKGGLFGYSDVYRIQGSFHRLHITLSLFLEFTINHIFDQDFLNLEK